MTDVAEVETFDSVDHYDGPENHNFPGTTGALVEVTFQKDPNKKQKYLEGEPKVLGVTEIILSIFFISVKLAFKQDDELLRFVICCFSSVGIIAGSVAIAALNLHLPKLKACLAMQVLTCVLSVISFISSSALVVDNHIFYYCWPYRNSSTSKTEKCEIVLSAYDHVIGIEMLVQAALVAISATVASFCCKVIQCCSPRASVPMIVVNTPSGLQ